MDLQKSAKQSLTAKYSTISHRKVKKADFKTQLTKIVCEGESRGIGVGVFSCIFYNF